jgi:hypothetical protein
MTLPAFWAKTEAHPDLSWIGVDAKPQELLVRQTTSDGVIDRAITQASILNNRWEDIEDVLMGRKEGQTMLHMTRIVGYYAYLPAWNKSKLAELRDRRQGDYAVPEPTGAAT